MKSFFIFILILNLSLFASDDFEIDDEPFDSFAEEFATPTKPDLDPLKSYNIIMTEYNDFFYTTVFFPIAKNYAKILPTSARLSISNFFDNLNFPVRVINNLAQLKFKNSLEETQRFVINSTIGVVGFFDVAKDRFNLKKHNEDFGQTLGFYGVAGGFHIVLPFLGPSNLRDSFSILVDSQADVIYKLQDEEVITAKTLFYINETTFKTKEYESLKQDAVHLYSYLKNIYEQHRESEINK